MVLTAHLLQQQVPTRHAESLQCTEDNAMSVSTPTSSNRLLSSAESKKTSERWSEEEEKALVQLWAEKRKNTCFIDRYGSEVRL